MVVMTKQTSVLMCRADFFNISYEINPWMKTANPVKPELAQRQWQELYDVYTNQLGWQVKLVEPVDGLPDMVFTANAGLVIDNRVALANFRHKDRQPESDYFKRWFESETYEQILQPEYNFEGEGDALVWNDYILAGYPWRSSQLSQPELGRFFKREIVGLQLTDARFYHLDTCLTPIDPTTLAIYTPAFTDESVAKLRRLVENLVETDQADAMAYGLNAISDGTNIVIPAAATGLIASYQKLGFKCWPVPISEFQKSGGGIKCLTLKLS